MRQQFETVRAKFGHSGNKGTNTEAILRDFLREYLPRRYDIGTGEIMDSGGRRSAQTDVVIVTGDHPFTFTQHQPGLFFVEGVLAAGEVKSLLTSEHLANSIANAVRLRGLKPRPTGMKMIWTMNASDNKRFGNSPACFLFAFESQLSLHKIHEQLSTQTQRSLDAAFVFNQGVVLDLGDGGGLVRFDRSDGGVVQGWCQVEGANVLAFLLLWLSALPDIQHGGSILPRYLLQALFPSNDPNISINEIKL